MAHNTQKYHSYGVFTSANAVKSRPTEELAKLFFTTNSMNSFRGDVHSPRGRSESAGQIHNIGKKATKYMPYQYTRSPLMGKSSCSHAQDFYQKTSEYKENAELAECFRGPGKTVNDAPLLVKRSRSGDTYLSPSRKQLLSAAQASKDPNPGGRTKTLGGIDMSLVTESCSHRYHIAPPQGHSLKGRTIVPLHNLAVSGVDSGDCYRTTYGSEFWKKEVPGSLSLQRAASAPGSVRSGPASEVSVGRDPEIQMTRRNIFTGPGK